MIQKPSICRFCAAYCGILVDIDDGRPVRVLGDPADPAYRGFTCAKGRQLPAQHAHPERLLHSVKRGGDSEYKIIASSLAVEEIARKIAAIVERHGPNSVAIYIGTQAGINPSSSTFAVSWLQALGSRMIFTAATIDQPGKSIASALHGRWLAGAYLFDEADCWMMVGANPIVSMAGGLSPVNPAQRIKTAKKRGLKLIVIDPRRTETAKSADIYLQPRPGEDPVLLGAMLHVIFDEHLYDDEFLDTQATGFEMLRDALGPFTPAYAAQRADVPEEAIVRAARLFACGRRGGAVAGTGPNMSGKGNITEYLLLCLNTVCGYWRREGQSLPNPGVLLPVATPKAQATGPRKAWGFEPKLRTRGLTNTASGLPTAALADEILLEGEGKIRALICVGGNPALAWPDQPRTLAAFQNLELSVALDIKMSATARLSDYIIAPKLSLEAPGCSRAVEAYEQAFLHIGYTEPYARHTPAVVDPPEGSDLLEEWQFFYRLAQQMNLDLRLYPVRAEVGALRDNQDPLDLDMAREPGSEEILEFLARQSRVPLDTVRQHPNGALFKTQHVTVTKADPDCKARLEIGDKTMLSELAVLYKSNTESAGSDASKTLPYTLVSRRMANVYNSSGRDLTALHGKDLYNPVYIHPGDMQELGLKPGDIAKISSVHGNILAVSSPDTEVRPGVISLSHCFGDLPSLKAGPREAGCNPNQLIGVDYDYDPYTGIPLMSGVPVAIKPYDPEQASNGKGVA